MRGLLIIDIQRDYFPGGAFPLVAPEAAAEAARDALAAFRAGGEPVVHLRHIWDDPEAPFFRKGSEGTEIHPLVAPAEGETVITKDEANGFLGTNLEDHLRTTGIDQLVVAGMMSSMCVDATVRAGADLGFGMTVIHDGCPAPDLEFGGTTVPGASVHAAFMAALGSGYATLTSSRDV
jgi:nicotinamidase-related amidase